MEPITVAVRRGGVVEAVHRVHGVAVQGGALVAELGDSQLVCYLRSSAKPFQALQLARACPELDEADLAIACSSHQAEGPQLEAVARLLEKAGATPGQLENGTQDGRTPEPLFHNCSGKHAGMLAVCRARGWLMAGYRLPEHPLQQAILHEVGEAAQTDPDEIEVAVDGCAAPTYALPLERMALAFSRLEALPEGAGVAAAMRAHPDLVGGARADDTALMRELPGWTAKRGAEGLFCAAGPGGLGVAVKSEDGSTRPLRPALAALLQLLERPLEAFRQVECRNSRGEAVGIIEVA